MFATIHAWWTVLMLAVFIGIVVWAYSGRRKKDFDEAARLALDEDEDESNLSIGDQLRDFLDNDPLTEENK